MTGRRPRSSLTAEVAPLAGAPDGFTSELVVRVPSDLDLVEEAVELVARHCEPDFADPRVVRFNLRVALSEALANAILYGNRSDPALQVAIVARVGRTTIDVEVQDEGSGFDPSTLPDPTSPERVQQPDGRGIYLIRQLMDEVRFNESGNSVRMLLRRDVPAARGGRLQEVVDALGEALGAPLRLWRAEGITAHLVAGPPGPTPALDHPRSRPHQAQSGVGWVQPVPGFPGMWVQIDGARAAAPRARAVATVVGDVLRSEQEASMVASELASRYEEIDLLYTIADILGRTVRLEEAATVIVRELADVVGARRASIMVHDESTDQLRLVAGRGLEMFRVTPASLKDPDSIAARVFREQRMLAHDATLAGPHPGRGEERGYLGGSFVSLPITYQPPGGTPRPVGVINLTDRIGGDAFTVGHKKLLEAVAAQVGAAIENARLVEGERRRVRLDTELVLAQSLQAALMPSQAVLSSLGDIAARTTSAESVGGDFFRAQPLRPGVVGVMIGDVSSHGLSAALLMAHATAAAGIVAQTARSAEMALQRLLEVIGDELARTEMHLAIFYGILDHRRGVLRYANAGHPQAFHIPAGGEPRRLLATAPPLGLGRDGQVAGARVALGAGDLLCLCSDGLTEAQGPTGEHYTEERLLALVRRELARPTREIVSAVFRDVERFAGPHGRDDRTLLLMRH